MHLCAAIEMYYFQIPSRLVTRMVASKVVSIHPITLSVLPCILEHVVEHFDKIDTVEIERDGKEVKDAFIAATKPV